MNKASFRFYAELNDFLPRDKRMAAFDYPFRDNPSVKDAIEALGIPHTEVDMIVVNSKPAGFDHKLADGDNVSVYPVFESLNIGSVTLLREKPLRKLKFISDVHLGKLTRYLRLCGFDTICYLQFNDNEIINSSLTEKRIILTRDKGLLKNRRVTHGYWIRSQYPDEQLVEVLKRFNLAKEIEPFTRCMNCNEVLADTNRQYIKNRLLPLTRRYFRKFKICPGCHNIYWNGSHYHKMKEFLRKLKKRLKE